MVFFVVFERTNERIFRMHANIREYVIINWKTTSYVPFNHFFFFKQIISIKHSLFGFRYKFFRVFVCVYNSLFLSLFRTISISIIKFLLLCVCVCGCVFWFVFERKKQYKPLVLHITKTWHIVSLSFDTLKLFVFKVLLFGRKTPFIRRGRKNLHLF